MTSIHLQSTVFQDAYQVITITMVQISYHKRRDSLFMLATGYRGLRIRSHKKFGIQTK